MDSAHPLAVVTPTLDGDVLARLALADAAFTPGQLQRLVPTASVDGVRRVLNRLSTQGIVIATRVGNAAVMYTLNRDHVAAPAIVSLASQHVVVRHRLREAIAAWDLKPVHAALFGSWARRDGDAASDIDLLLVRPDDDGSPQDRRHAGLADELWDDQIAKLESDLTRWTGNDARALVISELQFVQHPDDPVLVSVAHEGTPVHGDAAAFRKRVLDAARARQAENCGLEPPEEGW